MLTALPMYPHQEQAVDALTYAEPELISFPTGGGKGVMIAHVALRWITEHPGDRVLVGVHTQELVEQLAKTLRAVAPLLDVGIVKAGHNDVTSQVIVFSVQTLRHEKRRSQITGVGLLIWDEAHHCTAQSYKTVTGHFPDVALVGFTATPERGDRQSLGSVWKRVAASRDVSWMVRHKWLIPPYGKAVEVPDLDLTKVKRSGGDYQDGALGDALADSLAPDLVAAAWLEHARNAVVPCPNEVDHVDQMCTGSIRFTPDDVQAACDTCGAWRGRRAPAPVATEYRRTVAFFPTVESCYAFAKAFERAGVDARVVHGGLPSAERKALLDGHRAGVFPVLGNCMILTEGYDDPTLGCVLIGRPTRSRPLHMQIAGRGLRVDLTRPYEEQDCLLLYVVGNAPIPELRTMADLSDRPIEMKDGRSLVDLEDEFDAGPGVGPDAPVYYRGEVVVREFDPLARKSSKVWIRTKGGAYFVPAGKHAYVFIMEYPSPGLWSVAWAGVYGSTRMMPDGQGVPRVVSGAAGRSVGMTEHRGLPLDQAMIWAEDLAVDMGAETMVLANKRAPWRRGHPSDKTVRLAEGLGIDCTGLKAGAVSDLIGIELGSQRIDPLVERVRAQ